MLVRLAMLQLAMQRQPAQLQQVQQVQQYGCPNHVFHHSCRPYRRL